MSMRTRIRQSLTIDRSIFDNSRFFLQSLTIRRSIFDNSQRRFKNFCQLSKIDQLIVKDCLILILVLMTRSPRLLPLAKS